MTGPVYRLYIAEFETCDVWMRDGSSHFKKYIKPYDMYVIYQLGRERLPVGSERFLNVFGELGEQCKVVDAREMRDEDLHAHMLEQIGMYATRDTYILFLGCRKEHDAIRGKFSCYKSVVESDTFYYSRITLPPGTADAFPEKKGPAGKDPEDNRKNHSWKDTIREPLPEPIEATLIEEEPGRNPVPDRQEQKGPGGGNAKKGNSVPFFGPVEGEKAEKGDAPPSPPDKKKGPGGKPGKGKPGGRKPDRKNQKGRPQDGTEADTDRPGVKEEAGKGEPAGDHKGQDRAADKKERPDAPRKEKEEKKPAPDPAAPGDGKNKKKGGNQKPREQGAGMMGFFASGLFHSPTVGDQPSPGSSRPVNREEEPPGQKTPEESRPEREPEKKTTQEPAGAQEPEKTEEKAADGKTAGGKAEGSPDTAEAGREQGKWEQRISHDPARKDETSREWQERQALEKAIFGVKYSGEMPERTYSELDDSKALTVSLIADRLITNINRMVPSVKKQGFCYDDYMEFVATLVKSEDFADFMEGWMTVSGGLLIDQKEMKEAYPGLRREAQYYARTCDILYGEDGW